MFNSEAALKPIYEQLSRQAVIAVKAENVSSFLGKKVTSQLAKEIDNRLSIRFEGTCMKHRMDSASVKIYDKYGQLLRIETTTNDVSFFKHHRSNCSYPPRILAVFIVRESNINDYNIFYKKLLVF